MKPIYTTLLMFLGLLSSFLTKAQGTLIIDQDFNHWNDRKYTVADAKSDFNNKVKPWTASTYRGISAPGAASNLIGDVKQETRIVNGELRAEYTKNDAGGYAGGFLFDPYFDGVEEAYLEYKVKFDDNFFWATGGKLPGLGGSTSGINSETTGRGTIPSGCKYNTNGWSARLMWRRNRAQTTQPYLILYSYFAEREDGGVRQDGDCGDAKRIYTGLNDNTWYTVRQYVKMNTPGQNDGVVTMWINGVETYKDTKAKIRNSGKGNLKINALIMNTYRGGSRTDPVWHSPRDEYAFFDDFKVWTGSSEPPNGGGNTNLAPTGEFDSQTVEAINEGYEQLYILANASDPNGDEMTATLKIDGTTIRTEFNAPYEWGHATTPDPEETLHLTPGEHLFEVVITDSKGASTTISKTITVNNVVIPPAVQITYPKDGDIFHIGEEIVITAMASDEDGAVDRINFKLDGGYHSQDMTGDVYSTSFIFDSPGFYELGARAFDDEGSSTEVSVTIEVKLVSWIASTTKSILMAYPNPTRGVVHLNRECNWNLYSAQGQLILQGKSDKVDLSTESTGMYVLRMENQMIPLIRE